jgi:hypothetical protein
VEGAGRLSTDRVGELSGPCWVEVGDDEGVDDGQGAQPGGVERADASEAGQSKTHETSFQGVGRGGARLGIAPGQPTDRWISKV